MWSMRFLRSKIDVYSGFGADCVVFQLYSGKVFVYTGILPICQDEDGLAAVLGHEIAHVVARHPAERMSNSFLTLGTVFLISLLFDVSGQLSSMLVNLMWSLPNSRTQEVCVADSRFLERSDGD